MNRFCSLLIPSILLTLNLVAQNIDLATASNFNSRFDGAAASGQLGYSVAYGDINGDGIKDIIIGSYGASNNSRTNSGSVYVIYGAAGTSTANINDLLTSGNYNIRFDGAAASNNLGASVGSGDINGDGFDDIIAGAFFASNNGRGSSGSVYVIYGAAGTSTGDNRDLATSTNYNVRFDGEAQSNYLGTSVSSGDINGDGFDDIVAGASNALNKGSVYVIYGASGTSTGNNRDLATAANYNLRFDAADAGERFGISVSCGDINGDGFDDIVSGASNASKNSRGYSGSTYVIYGAAGTSTGNIRDLATSTNYNVRFDGVAAFDNLGFANGVGDINGDGFDDIIVGAANTANNGRSLSGSVYVIYGTAGTSTGNDRDLTSTANYNLRFDGAAANNYLGSSVGSGDVNGDGFDDVIAGAYFAANNSRNGSGSVYVLYGAAGTSTGNDRDLSNSANYSFRYDGAAAGDYLGQCVSSGDLNGDGFDDVIAGAYYANNNSRNTSGSVYLMYPVTAGTPGSKVRQSPSGNAPAFKLGTENVKVDFADGSAGTVSVQRLLSQPSSNAWTVTGSVYWSLATTKTSVTNVALTFRYTDAQVAGFTEASLKLFRRNAGGTGADWSPVLGASVNTSTNQITGTVNQLGEFTLGTDVNIDLATASNFNSRFDGAAAIDRSGRVAYGDINGDGIKDIIMGAYTASNNGRGGSGSVYVIYGAAGTTTANIKDLLSSGNYNIRYDGAAASDILGASVRSGDINGDGFDDVIAGASAASNNGRGGSGSVYVIYGAAGTSTGNIRDLATATNYNLRFDGAAASNYFGSSVSSADINGDGFDDIVAGAYAASNNSLTGSGSVYVIFGAAGTSTGNNRDLGTAANYNLRFDGAAVNDQLGNSVGSGDVNGDGFDDVVAGSPNASNNSRTNSGSAYVIYGAAGIGTGNIRDLATSTNYNLRFDGAAAVDIFSCSISSGDVNGDGFDDIIAGAFFASNNSRSTSGSVYVIYGAAGTSTGNNRDLASSSNYNLRFDGAAAGDYFGGAISTGDINGDGFIDIIAGASSASNNGRAGSGSVYVICGAAATSTGNNRDLATATNYQFRYDGAAASEYLGFVSSGDINGDGFNDIIAGTGQASNNGRTNSGSTYLIYPVIAGTPAAKMRQSPAGNAPAFKLATENIKIDFADGSAGTVGVQRLLSMPSSNASGVTASVYWSLSTTKTSVTSAVVTFRYTDAQIAGLTESSLKMFRRNAGGAASDWLPVSGTSVNTSTNQISGTVSQLGDFALGADPNIGLPRVDLALASNFNSRFDGAAVYDLLGASVASGDVNGDGIKDMIVGAYNTPRSGINGAGSVYVFYGAAGTSTASIRDLLASGNFNIRYDAAGPGMLGGSTSSGDINGDGFDDIVIAAAGASNNGRTTSGSVYVIYGTAGTSTGNVRDLATATTYNIRLDGAAANMALGSSVSVGDINGDGFDDIIAGAWAASSNSRSGSGSVYVIYGAAGTSTGNNRDLAISTNYNLRFDGAVAGDGLGFSLSRGDINGDGFDDIIVGAPAASNNSRGYSGVVYVIYGAAGTSTGNNRDLATSTNFNLRFDGGAYGDNLGNSVSTGDINGDGFDDIVAGANYAVNNSPYQSGSVYVIYGATGTGTGNTRDLAISTSYNLRFDGEYASRLGSSVSSGDMNGDGFGDVLAGAYLASNNGRGSSGSVYVLYGAAGTSTGNNRYLASAANYNIRYDGTMYECYLGYSVSSGDINGDGFDDIIAGGMYASNNSRYRSGSMFLLNPVTAGTPAIKVRQSPAGDVPPVSFDTENISIDFAAGSSGTVSVQRRATQPSTGAPANTAGVSWLVTTTKTGITGTSVRLRYTDAQVAGLIEANLQLFKRAIGGGATDWTLVAGTTLDVATNRISGVVDSFSEFTLGDVSVLPIQLTSFTATANRLNAELGWRTETEVDNYGFEVERRAVSGYARLPDGQGSQVTGPQPETRNPELGTIWSKVDFVKGSGTSTSPRDYSYVDRSLQSGRYAYRIKQIDQSGSFTYTSALEVEVGLAPRIFTLSQNYPNPFNPTTTIEFTVPEDGKATLRIYDVLGREVATLFNGEVKAGYYQQAVFEATRFATGIYIARLNYLPAGSLAGGEKQLLRKMLLVK